jgi:hypothetical protein
MTMVLKVVWPSGLRRWFKAPFSPEARVRISSLSRTECLIKLRIIVCIEKKIETYFLLSYGCLQSYRSKIILKKKNYVIIKFLVIDHTDT